MIEAIVSSLLPAALRELRKVAKSDRILLALFVRDLCTAFVDEDKDGFIILINKASFPDDWKMVITKALWADGTDQAK